MTTTLAHAIAVRSAGQCRRAQDHLTTHDLATGVTSRSCPSTLHEHCGWWGREAEHRSVSGNELILERT